MVREDFVENRTDVINNLMTLYSYAKSENEEEKRYALARYRQGRWYVVEKIGDRLVFGPSRFIGYKENTISKHEQNHGHGGETNNQLTTKLKIYKKIEEDDFLFDSFNQFLLDLGIDMEEKVASFMIPIDLSIENLKQDTVCYFVSPTHCGGYKPQSWEGMLSKQLFAIGWNQTDYTKFSEKDIEEEYQGDKSAISAFKTIKKVKEGDLVCATNNSHGLWGIGVAISTYQFSEQIHYAGVDENGDDNYYSHYIKVAWLKYQPQGYIPINTFHITPSERGWEPYGTITSKNPIPSYITNYLYNENMQIQNIIDSTIINYVKLLEAKHQIILQGAPGTGKTYTAKDIAEQMIFGSISSKKDDQARLLKDSAQFKLVQFHPSYTYEDFVRGIVVSTEDSDKPQYKTVNKILGEFAERALSNWENHKKEPETITYERKVDEAFDSFKEQLYSEMNEDGEYQLTAKVKIFLNDESAFRYIGMGSSWSKTGNRMLFKDIIQAFLDGNKERQDIVKNKNLSGLAQQDASYYVRVLNLFQEFVKEHPIEKFDVDSEKEDLKGYILIIDEINRANLPAVLGELIYALEYRGQAVETMYKLNNGKNELILPPNLYIIGTMNTADRSVGQIDYAIRRRFAFVNVETRDLSVELGDKFDSVLFNKVKELFTEEYLNSEFEAKDVQLGHSYFIINVYIINEKYTRMDLKSIPLRKDFQRT